MTDDNFLEIVARARDVTHWNKLRDREVMLVEREMFESSLRSARSVLELLGHGAGCRHHRVNGMRQEDQIFAKLAQDYGVPLQALYDQQAAQAFVQQNIQRPAQQAQNHP